jgi:hypothetical protein
MQHKHTKSRASGFLLRVRKSSVSARALMNLPTLLPMNRRTFFRVSAAGVILLGAGTLAYRTFAPQVHTKALPGAFLDANARAALAAIAPAVLGEVFPKESAARNKAISETVDRVDAAIRGLAPTAQKEVAELMMLLTLKPARWALTGISDWQPATPEQLSAFLTQWRTHRLGLLQVAYHALHDLIGGSHYSDPSAWVRTGYALPKGFEV